MAAQRAPGRCVAPGCGRFTRAGAERCPRHGGWDEEEAGEDDGVRAATRAAFQARLARGEYRGLFPPPLSEILAQAAAEKPLVDEIGALRVTLARLLAEEMDPAKLAASVARVAGVAIQAARAQRAMAGEGGDDLGALLARLMAEEEGEDGDAEADG